ncbi:MAG: Crp/Fnr family transcriptional regulator [Burkholderiaceae bacterium]
MSYPPGKTVFRQGSPARAVYHVRSGAVRLVRFGRAGEEIVLHEARAGEMFAEASLDSTRYHCNAVAIEPSELLKIPSDAIQTLLDTDRAFAREWIALLAGQLRTTRTRLERLSLKSAADRVRHLLVSEGQAGRFEVTVPGTLKDLARSLGLTHEALYRTLARMTREGMITREGSTIRLIG